jgi:dTDP-glucose 4,6-dehydratase
VRILVTGGAGFIGSNLVHHLLAPDRAERVELVVNLDALTYAGNRDNLSELVSDSRHIFVEGSIGDEALVASLLAQHRIEGVMHLAAETHVDRSIDSPEPFAQTNVVGTLRLLESCRRHWAKLAGPDRERFRFLHVRSSFLRDDPLRAAQSVCGLEGGERPFRARLRPHLRHAGRAHQLLE